MYKVDRKHQMLLSELLYIILFNLLYFQSFLQKKYGGALNYIDEIITLLFLFLMLVKIIFKKTKSSLNRHEKIIIGLMVVVVLIGLFSNLISDIRLNTTAIFIDIFSCSRFILILISALIVFKDTTYLVKYIVTEIKFLSFFIFVFMLINLLVDINMTTEFRFGIRSFCFIFPHPTYLVASSVGFLALLCLDIGKNKLYIILNLLIIISTLRLKAIGIALASVYIILLYRKKQKLKFIQIAFLGVILLIIAWDQIMFYFSNTQFARAALQNTSFVIANDFFPFGSGFASFGSYMSGVNYSPLYYKYRISSIYGLSENNISFLSDTFWPTVIAQFGWMGFVLFGGILYELYKTIITRSKDNHSVFIPCILILAYFFISSTSESSFFNPFAIYLMLMMAISLKSKTGGYYAITK